MGNQTNQNSTSFGEKIKGWAWWVKLIVFVLLLPVILIAGAAYLIYKIWTKSNFNNVVKIILSIVIALVAIIVTVSILSPKKSNDNNPVSAGQNQATTSPTEISATTSSTIVTTTAEPTTQALTGEELIKHVVSINFNESPNNLINFVPDNDNFLLIRALGKDNLTLKWTRKGLYKSMIDTMKELKNEDIGTIDFNVLMPLTDVYGNTEESIVIKASFPKEVRDKINYDTFDIDNIPVIAVDYWEHQSLTKD